MDKKVFKQEKTHLNRTIKVLGSASSVLNKAMLALGDQNLETLKDMRDDPVTSSADFMMFVQQLHEKNESFNVKDKVQQLDELDYLMKEPYFARIDLGNDTGKEQSIYIGKFGFSEDRKPLVTDWRAKVASVYYRYRYPQKNVRYESQEGEITNDLALKRTFEIDNGELIKYYNNDIQFDESEIIVEKIEERTGGVLEDIIETIQESQMDIIESDPRKICIVQGCVGSGKSTVAIHKLSHTFFNYPNIITPERSILVAKSNVLVGYLATLFPKLGIFDINYKTLRELIINLVFREEMKIKYDLDRGDDLSNFTLKEIGQLEKDLEEIHKAYEKDISKILEKEGYESFSSFVYSSNQSVKENLDEFISDLNEELDFQKNKLKDDPKSIKSWIYKENISNLRDLIKDLQQLKAKLKKGALKKVCKKWKINLNGELGYLQILIYLFIHFELFGFRKSLKYQYCVVDEGQDFSPLEYLVLGKVVLKGRFCILGDLNQSYFDEGLSDWNVIQRVISEASDAATFELDTNYRSTKQIIDLANGVISSYTSDYLPKSIDRVGSYPVVEKFDGINDVVNTFKENITSDVERLDKSIGIICFDDEICGYAEEVLDELAGNKKIPENALIKIDEKKRVSYIPKGVYLSSFEGCKGLEFSKVYVLGLDLDIIDNFNDAKKAFVAVTRAMNELMVYGYTTRSTM